MATISIALQGAVIEIFMTFLKSFDIPTIDMYR